MLAVRMDHGNESGSGLGRPYHGGGEVVSGGFSSAIGRNDGTSAARRSSSRTFSKQKRVGGGEEEEEGEGAVPVIVPAVDDESSSSTSFSSSSSESSVGGGDGAFHPPPALATTPMPVPAVPSTGSPENPKRFSPHRSERELATTTSQRVPGRREPRVGADAIRDGGVDGGGGPPLPPWTPPQSKAANAYAGAGAYAKATTPASYPDYARRRRPPGKGDEEAAAERRISALRRIPMESLERELATLEPKFSPEWFRIKAELMEREWEREVSELRSRGAGKGERRSRGGDRVPRGNSTDDVSGSSFVTVTVAVEMEEDSTAAAKHLAAVDADEAIGVASRPDGSADSGGAAKKTAVTAETTFDENRMASWETATASNLSSSARNEEGVPRAPGDEKRVEGRSSVPLQRGKEDASDAASEEKEEEAEARHFPSDQNIRAAIALPAEEDRQRTASTSGGGGGVNGETPLSLDSDGPPDGGPIKSGSLRKASRRIWGGWKVKRVEVRRGVLSYCDAVNDEDSCTMETGARTRRRASFGNFPGGASPPPSRQMIRSLSTEAPPLGGSAGRVAGKPPSRRKDVPLRGVRARPSKTFGRAGNGGGGGGGVVFEITAAGGRRRLWMAETHEEGQDWIRAIREATEGAAAITAAGGGDEPAEELEIGGKSGGRRRRRRPRLKMRKNVKIKMPIFTKKIGKSPFMMPGAAVPMLPPLLDLYLRVRSETTVATSKETYLTALSRLGNKRLAVPVRWVKDRLQSDDSHFSGGHGGPLSSPDAGAHAESDPSLAIAQLWKDLRRDAVDLDGEVLRGDDEDDGGKGTGGGGVRGPEAIVARLTRRIQEASSSSSRPTRSRNRRITEEQAASYALDILLACDRTRSGGDSYYCAENLCLNRCLVVICPASLTAEPLCVAVLETTTSEGDDDERSDGDDDNGDDTLEQTPKTESALVLNGTHVASKMEAESSKCTTGSIVEVCIRVSTKYKICTLDPQGIESEDTWATLQTTFVENFRLSGGANGKMVRGEEVVDIELCR